MSSVGKNATTPESYYVRLPVDRSFYDAIIFGRSSYVREAMTMTICTTRPTTKILILSLQLLLIFQCSSALALMPEEVAVIANKKVSKSLDLARYYMRQRQIPPDNLIIIETAQNEIINRNTYRTTIAEPVRKALKKLTKAKRIRCLVTLFGVPLKVKSHFTKSGDGEQAHQLNDLIASMEKEKESASEKKHQQLESSIFDLQTELGRIKQPNNQAAVDSELALVLTDEYPLEGWLANPYFLGFAKKEKEILLKRDKVLMVSRLDAPTPKIVRRIIDDSIAAEKTTLQGTAFFDARWPKPDEKELSGYALYDASLHSAAEILKQTKRMDVVLDEQEPLFERGTCPQTALYCGWYSLARYVDSCKWVQGAVGYHIASSECTTLKDKKSQVWCKRMLEEGIGATIGPVYEPFVQGFPPPALFFDKLTEGYLSLGEVYLISLPYFSWQMILIGDPLYQPFKPKELKRGNQSQGL